MDWDAYWRFELFRRECEPLDFRRWKRDSQRELRRLHPGSLLLLDSTAGLGDHTVNLAEEGFTVEACDASAVARDATRRAVAVAGLDVPVFDARWEALGRPGRYDLIFNDALHWVYDEDELARALRGFRDALRPGGTLVYFFADQLAPGADAGRRVLDWDWERLAPSETLWERAKGPHRVTLTVTRERGPDFIDEHHRYDERRGDGSVRTTRLTMRRVYRWDWYHLTPLLAAAGFEDMRSDHFENVKGHHYALSRARRPP
jgi:SAM-dependent methyltransferase